jgi:hypothetical protein
MRNPNGGLLNVDVTLLQMGLSRCRSVAEDGLAKLARGATVDIEHVLNEIVEEVRRTLYEIADNDMQDEIGAILKEEDENGTTHGK